MIYNVALPEPVHQKASSHLLQHAKRGRIQEDLCFALWRPSTGKQRKTAIVFDIRLPGSDDRNLHKNASFEPDYLTSSVRAACSLQAGLAFMHNHLSPGWQEMSDVDVVAERDRICPATRATGLPLVGLTLGTDGSWSARFWIWDGEKFNRIWCDKVRVVGRRFNLTLRDRHPLSRSEFLLRTVDTWGEECQKTLSNVHFGVVGAGSVGSVICETLARIGIQNMTVIDPDRVEPHNLDRLLYATKDDIGRRKVDLICEGATKSATSRNFNILAISESVQNDRALASALDCDVLFCAVDRPIPKDLLNHIAFAHCIPLIFGGVFIDSKHDGTLGQAAWGVTVAGPQYRCLRCDGQYTSSDVVQEHDGSLDSPSYVRQAADAEQARVNQNVFPFCANLASAMVLEMIRIVIAEDWWPDSGGRQHYSYIPNCLEASRFQCKQHCTVVQNICIGDRYQYPFAEGIPAKKYD